MLECFPVFFGFKPAVDAYRIAIGKKQEAGQIVDPMTELTVMKSIEMVAEAIPGVIIQLMAIATTGAASEVSYGAWFSLAISSITTGFSSATISYDFDTNPVARRHNSEFYGYVPSKKKKRSIVFASMAFLTSSILLMRCMTIVVLGMISSKAPFLYVFIDVGLYLIVKMIRGDFWYWIPLGGKSEILSSLLIRILAKIITDFTCIIQFRHPNEVGGIYWAVSFIFATASLPTASILLSERQGRANYGAELASTFAFFLIPVTIISTIIFLMNIERRYWKTFYSTETSKKLCLRRFGESESDASKVRGEG